MLRVNTKGQEDKEYHCRGTGENGCNGGSGPLVQKETGSSHARQHGGAEETVKHRPCEPSRWLRTTTCWIIGPRLSNDKNDEEHDQADCDGPATESTGEEEAEAHAGR